MEHPSKAARDAANAKMMSDPRMKEMGACPRRPAHDIRRFAPIVDESAGGAMGYADGYLVLVPAVNKDAYRAMAEKAAVTDYRGAVRATGDETVVYSWVEWPSKAARDEGWKKGTEDERMKPDRDKMPFDGQRMVYGGFAPILDE